LQVIFPFRPRFLHRLPGHPPGAKGAMHIKRILLSSVAVIGTIRQQSKLDRLPRIRSVDWLLFFFNYYGEYI
jgi:hypothetical protein